MRMRACCSSGSMCGAATGVGPVGDANRDTNPLARPAASRTRISVFWMAWPACCAPLATPRPATANATGVANGVNINAPTPATPAARDTTGCCSAKRWASPRANAMAARVRCTPPSPSVCSSRAILRVTMFRAVLLAASCAMLPESAANRSRASRSIRSSSQSGCSTIRLFLMLSR